MWFRDPFPHFHPDYDIHISSDFFNGNPFDMLNAPNTGFMFVRSNNRTIKFYKFWRSSRWKEPNIVEQLAFFRIIRYSKYIKKTGLKVRFLDTEYMGGFCSPSKDLSKVCTMHSNCCVGLDNKIDDLNSLLEDWKGYVNGSLPRDRTTPFRWSAPAECAGLGKRNRVSRLGPGPEPRLGSGPS